ncbi:MAG: hypothetical protein LKE37_09895 [Atopobiaceae bacterium]|jgi:hypothetical protein|nr:hypothetical protein [Atopobiaceae bacterium]
MDVSADVLPRLMEPKGSTSTTLWHEASSWYQTRLMRSHSPLCPACARASATTDWIFPTSERLTRPPAPS